VAEATIMKQEDHDAFFQPKWWTTPRNRVIPGTLPMCYKNVGYDYLATRQEGGKEKTRL
jgi:hypothetical protein